MLWWESSIWCQLQVGEKLDGKYYASTLIISYSCWSALKQDTECPRDITLVEDTIHKYKLSDKLVNKAGKSIFGLTKTQNQI